MPYREALASYRRPPRSNRCGGVPPKGGRAYMRDTLSSAKLHGVLQLAGGPRLWRVALYLTGRKRPVRPSPQAVSAHAGNDRYRRTIACRLSGRTIFFSARLRPSGQEPCSIVRMLAAAASTYIRSDRQGPNPNPAYVSTA